jgi:hypothetical protein
MAAEPPPSAPRIPAAEPSAPPMPSVPVASTPSRRGPPPSAPIQPPAEPPPALASLQPAAPISAPRATAPDLVRVRAAQQVGDRLLAYLAGRGARIPPIWDSPGPQQAASQMRDGLLAAEGAKLATPDWRIGGDAASLEAGVRYTDGREGRLRARMVWREQRWLVSDVAMERDW